MFGYAWFSAHARRDSPTLDGEMKAYEGLADAMADIIAPQDRDRKPALRGMIDFLTWRALRVAGGLSPEQARTELVTLIRPPCDRIILCTRARPRPVPFALVVNMGRNILDPPITPNLDNIINKRPMIDTITYGLTYLE